MERTISNTETIFQDLEWLIRARMQSKGIKPVFESIYVDGENNLICTDSRRLHVLRNRGELLESAGMEEGFYSVLRQTKRKITIKQIDPPGAFPDWKRLLPKGKDIQVICESITLNKFSGLARFYNAFYQKNNPVERTVTINPEFFHDAIYPEKACKIIIPNYWPTSPVLFDYGEKKAIVMPMQIKPYE